jgi:hypothetical protein
MEGVSLNQHLVSVLSFSVPTTLYRQTQQIIASTQFVHGSTTVTAVSWPVTSGQFHIDIVAEAKLRTDTLDVRSLPAGVPVIPGRVR